MRGAPEHRRRWTPWLLALRALALTAVAAQVTLMFVPDAFGALVRLPLWGQFVLGTVVLAALVVEVLAAAGLLSGRRP